MQVLTEVVDRQRVIGIGTQQNSLRFARAVASDLDVGRRHVRASVFGEHGLHMVPLWQTVELLLNSPSHQASLARLIARAMDIPLMTRVTDLMLEVEHFMAAGRIADAYDATCRALPDARIVVEPTITVQSMHSTPNATANATLQLIVAALTADKRRVHGQVKLAGEALEIDGVCGFPIMIDREGWRLWDTEYLDEFGIPKPPTLTADHDRKAANAIDSQCLAGQLHLAVHSAFVSSECSNDQLQRGVGGAFGVECMLCAVIIGSTTMRASGSARHVASSVGDPVCGQMLLDFLHQISHTRRQRDLHGSGSQFLPATPDGAGYRAATPPSAKAAPCGARALRRRKRERDGGRTRDRSQRRGQSAASPAASPCQ